MIDLSEAENTGQKALVIKAKGGLGNRMLSAATGIVLAKLNGRQPFVDWRDGMYVTPGQNLYPLLFDAKWMGQVDQFDSCDDVAPAIWAGRLNLHPTEVIHDQFPNRHQDPFLYRRMSIPLNKPDPSAPVSVFWSYLPKLNRLRRRMANDDRFGSGVAETTSDILDEFFRPVDAVKSQVDALFEGIDGPVIGVHIRFTDRKAPLPKIVSELRRLHSASPNASIFLATDSAEAQKLILAEFPNTISIEKALPKHGQALHVASGEFLDPLVEARNAVVDMVALSRCDWLIHSRHSTFSVTAALIGRIAESRQIDVDRHNPMVILKQFFQAWA